MHKYLCPHCKCVVSKFNKAMMYEVDHADNSISTDPPETTYTCSHCNKIIATGSNAFRRLAEDVMIDLTDFPTLQAVRYFNGKLIGWWVLTLSVQLYTVIYVKTQLNNKSDNDMIHETATLGSPTCSIPCIGMSVNTLCKWADIHAELDYINALGLTKTLHFRSAQRAIDELRENSISAASYTDATED